jgi:hypothetical protein
MKAPPAAPARSRVSPRVASARPSATAERTGLAAAANTVKATIPASAIEAAAAA